MEKRFLVLLTLFMLFPFLLGMGAKPKEVPVVVEEEEEIQRGEIPGVGYADGLPNTTPPQEYGNIILNRYTGEGQPMREVVFPHWWHRTQFTCKVCHLEIGFEMKAGSADIKMGKIFAGEFCGKCHNGTIAFMATACDRCHSKGIEVKENRNYDEIVKDFPPDCCGNKVNWVKALDEGNISPKATLDGEGEMMIVDFIVERPVKGGEMPNVLYPHKPHTQMLGCENCHPSIFEPRAGANPITMTKINAGNYCGVCHGKVAFPLEDCFRCHSKR
jgi:c(7)-type cytochrome triheme protein